MGQVDSSYDLCALPKIGHLGFFPNFSIPSGPVRILPVSFRFCTREQDLPSFGIAFPTKGMPWVLKKKKKKKKRTSLVVRIQTLPFPTFLLPCLALPCLTCLSSEKKQLRHLCMLLSGSSAGRIPVSLQ